MNGAKIEAARMLLAERDALLEAEVRFLAAQRNYVEAEKAYFAAVQPPADAAKGPGEWPDNVVIDGTAILPVEDWYDVKEGKRLVFHTVEVLS